MCLSKAMTSISTAIYRSHLSCPMVRYKRGSVVVNIGGIVDHHCFVILFIISFIRLPAGADNNIAVLIRVWKANGSIRGWVKLKINTLLFSLCSLITQHYNEKEWRMNGWFAASIMFQEGVTFVIMGKCLHVFDQRVVTKSIIIIS